MRRMRMSDNRYRTLGNEKGTPTSDATKRIDQMMREENVRLQEEIYRLRTELAEARKDGERLDWLEGIHGVTVAGCIANVTGQGDDWYWRVDLGNGPGIHGNTIRAAIDAAMGEGEGECKCEPPDPTKCPDCGGPTEHDRCYPPNPYTCDKCQEGEGE
jgi:hypothetical protein